MVRLLVRAETGTSLRARAEGKKPGGGTPGRGCGSGQHLPDTGRTSTGRGVEHACCTRKCRTIQEVPEDTGGGDEWRHHKGLQETLEVRDMS